MPITRLQTRKMEEQSTLLEALKKMFKDQEEKISKNWDGQKEELNKMFSEQKEHISKLEGRFDQYSKDSKEENESLRSTVNNLSNQVANIQTKVQELVDKNLDGFREAIEGEIRNVTEELKQRCQLQEDSLSEVRSLVEENQLEISSIKSQIESLHDDGVANSEIGAVPIEVIRGEVNKCLQNYVTKEEAKSMGKMNTISDSSGDKIVNEQQVASRKGAREGRSTFGNEGKIQGGVFPSAREWWEEFRMESGSNLSTKFPIFKPEGDIHPMVFLKTFSQSLPSSWSEERKIKFTASHLQGEAGEWSVINMTEFTDWKTFENLFKGKYWSKGDQNRLNCQLIDPPRYSNKWGGFRKYFEWHLTRRKFLDEPMTESNLLQVLVNRLPENVQEKLIDKDLSDVNRLLDYLSQLDTIKQKAEERKWKESQVDNSNQNKSGTNFNKDFNNKFCNLKRKFPGNQQWSGSKTGRQIDSQGANGSQLENREPIVIVTEENYSGLEGGSAPRS